jgi:hypothetical protein
MLTGTTELLETFLKTVRDLLSGRVILHIIVRVEDLQVREHDPYQRVASLLRNETGALVTSEAGGGLLLAHRGLVGGGTGGLRGGGLVNGGRHNEMLVW